MPFGPDCEFKTFQQCVDKYRGKVKDPEAYCGKIKNETEDKCNKSEGDSGEDEQPASSAIYGRPRSPYARRAGRR